MVTQVFLVADEEECESAIAMIERDGLDHCAVFKLTNEPHYAENIDHASKHVRKWEEYDVRESMFDYFSTGEYKQTESIFSDYLSNRDNVTPDYVKSECFQLPLIMNVGRYYLSPIEIFNKFIVKTNPSILFMNERAGLATELFSALTTAYGIPLKGIGVCVKYSSWHDRTERPCAAICWFQKRYWRRVTNRCSFF
jgi:hypothetical protein